MGKNVTKSKKNYHTSFIERLAYGLQHFGQNIFYVAIGMFLLPFFMDIGISAVTVGIITLIVKIWDAVNDPLFGLIVDKTKFKNGKFLPWLRISFVLLPVATLLMFSAHAGLNDVVKVLWVTIAYMLWDTAMTMSDVPLYAIVTTVTDNLEERSLVVTFGRVFGIFGAIISMFVIPSFRKAIGGWFPTIAVLSFIGVIVMLPFVIIGKERFSPVAAEKDISLRDVVKYFISNKYLVIFFGAAILKTAFDISSSVSLYVGRYLFNSEQIIGLLNLTVLVPTVLMGIFGGMLIKKFDKFNLFWFALLTMVILSIVTYFAGYNNLMLYIILSFLKSIASGVYLFLLYMFSPDCAEYGIYKSGIAATGSAFAIQSFSVKVGSAVATSLAAFTLASIGFASGEGAVQLPGFNDKLWKINTLVPVIGNVLSLIVLRFYKLRDKDVKIITQANYGEITREEAEKLLEGRNI